MSTSINCSQSLSGYLHEQQNIVKNDISQLPKSIFQQQSESAIIDDLVKKYQLAHIEFDWENAEIDTIQKATPTRYADPTTVITRSLRSLTSNYYEQDFFEYCVPIKGCVHLITLCPRTINMSLGEFTVSKGIFSILIPIPSYNPDQANGDLERTVNGFKSHFAFFNQELQEYNNALSNIIPEAVKRRLDKIYQLNTLAEKSGIPFKKNFPTAAPSNQNLTTKLILNPYEYYSVGISYAGEDAEVAENLYNFLNENGVSAMIFSKHAKIGETTDHFMFRMVHECERMILLCSEVSLNKTGVLNEIDKALGKEARQPGKINIMPIWLDKYVINGWNPPNTYVATEIRRKTGLKLLDHNFNSAETKKKLQKLLEDLLKEPVIS